MKVEPKIEPKVEPKVESKTQPKDVSKTQTKSEPKTQPKAEPKAPATVNDQINGVKAEKVCEPLKPVACCTFMCMFHKTHVFLEGDKD